MTARCHAVLFFLFFLDTKKKVMVVCCHHLLCSNNTKEKDVDALPSSSSQTQRRQNTPKKPREGRELIFKLSLCPFTFGSRFYPSISNAFSWHLLLLMQKKKKQRKKTIEKKINAEKGGSFPSNSHSAFSLLPSHFCLFVSNVFSWLLYNSQMLETRSTAIWVSLLEMKSSRALFLLSLVLAPTTSSSSSTFLEPFPT
jgi:hypothetical protein